MVRLTLTGASHIDTPIKKTQLQDVLPTFSATEPPAVYIENTHYDAKCFQYDKPLTRLGKAGFIADYGYRVGYFLSTWQGQPNRSLMFQDLQHLIDIANKRQATGSFDTQKLGQWQGDWHIAGTDENLIGMLKKIWISKRKPPC